MADREGVYMSYVIPVNRRKYERCQEVIQSGTWVADPDAGTLWSRKFRRFVGSIHSNGYIAADVWLPELRRSKTVYVHRVLWEAVHGPVPDGFEINHRDGDKTNPKMANLELTTHQGNVQHAHRTGLWPGIVNGPLGVEITAALESGMSYRVATQHFGVGQGTIARLDQARPGYKPQRRNDPNARAKRCTACREMRDLDEYSPRRSASDGRTSRCRPCVRAQYRASRRKLLDARTEMTSSDAHREALTSLDELAADLGVNLEDLSHLDDETDII